MKQIIERTLEGWLASLRKEFLSWSFFKARKWGIEILEWTRNLYSKPSLMPRDGSWKLWVCFAQLLGRNFTLFKPFLSSDPKAVKDGRFGTCQNSAHQQLQEEGSALFLRLRNPLAWSHLGKKIWKELDVPTWVPGTPDLLYPFHTTNSHFMARGWSRKDLPEKMWVNPAIGHMAFI